MSSIEYSTNSKIFLWNSLIEKILKNHGFVKKDNQKECGIIKLGIPISDICEINKLINLRNDIAHGDEVTSNKLFELGHDWELLIERIILAEIGFKNFSKTHLRVKI